MKYRIECFEGPTTLRLVQTDEYDRVTEEAVFSIKGILSGEEPASCEGKDKVSVSNCTRNGQLTIIKLVEIRKQATFDKVFH